LNLCAEADCDPIQPSRALGSATNTESAVTTHDLLGPLKLAEDRMYRHKLMEGKVPQFFSMAFNRKNEFSKKVMKPRNMPASGRNFAKLGQAIGLTILNWKKLSLLSVLHDIGKIGIPDHILLSQLN